MIEYRRARPEDVDAIARVHVQSSRETYLPIFGPSAKSPTVEDRVALWTDIVAHGDIAFVATDDDAVVGLCHGTGTTMTLLYLLASHHRRGIGQTLMRHLLTAFAARGVAELTFNALAANPNSVAFYEAQGARQLRREIMQEPEGPTEDIIFAISTV